ncbi:MAG: PH domain-containing protein [Chloroflexota bacterium]
MSFNQIQTEVTAKVWQAIAQSRMDFSGLAREDMNKLVEIVVDAALESVDEQLTALHQPSADSGTTDDVTSDTTTDSGEEELLWEGRPLLSLTVSYILTSERLTIKEGLIGKAATDIELVRVQAMDYKQSVTERALNVGDVFLTTHDPNHPDVTLENVKDPAEVHEILRRAVLNAREKYRLHYREEM